MEAHEARAECLNKCKYSFCKAKEAKSGEEKWFCHFGCDYFDHRGDLMLHLAKRHDPF